jgi:spermidine synthase
VALLLLISVFVVATCGLIYELVAGTLASYLLGDSITQFSTIIGVYLFSMGIGSYLSKFFNRNLIGWFVQIEILVGFIGGISSSLLFLLFEQIESFRILLYLLVSLTGILVGLEIPLLMRILKDRYEFKDLVSRVFTFDYIGALLASLIFPMLLVPYLGLIKTSFFFGILNVSVALIVCLKFQHETRWAAYLKSVSVLIIILLLLGFVFSEKIMSFSESMSFSDKVIFSKSSPYQRIVLTKGNREISLFLNGNLQFSSADEYRYHEALVHPGLQAVKNPKRVLVLGGGDGLAVREILKYPGLEVIKLVDLDKEITHLFSSNPMLTDLNKNSLQSNKVTIINADAFQWLKDNTEKFDFIAVDFPDPSSYSVGKLYTNTFYKVLFKALNNDGIVVVQSTSPFVAPKSFWCINNTLQSVGFHTIPYHTYVPSFGDWGYIMALKHPEYKIPNDFIADLRFINRSTFSEMINFPKDIPKLSTEVNRLNNQVLVNYFENEWSTYLR